MSHVVRVGKSVKFIGDAKHDDNVEGNFSMKKVYLYDDFLQRAEDATTWWEEHLDGTDDAFAITNAPGGVVRITTGTTDNEETIVNYGQLTWYGDKNCVVEARVEINDVSGTALFFGLADAAGEMSIDYKDGTLTTTATDAVGFLCDADKESSSIYCVGVKADTDETPIDTGSDWENDAWHILRIECATDGAHFYLDGNAVGFMDASQEGGNPLIITFSAETRADDGSNTIDIDYIKAWQDR